MGSRVAVLDESEVLANERFQQELKELATASAQSMEEAAAYAAKCLDELAVQPQERYLSRVVKLARFMTSRSYDPVLDVRPTEIDSLKELSKTHPLVFLWSHKSHLDSFVFLRALYENDFRPQPLSFAGINMNFMGFGTLAKRSGAIFLRRTFKDDRIYKLVFTHYIDYLVRERVPLSWSIEGTRSRTGKLMPPKLGLIQWVVASYLRTGCEDALLIPVSIAFDQIAEMDDYVSMQRGVKKRKESLRWFIDYIRGMSTPFGKIYVRFGEPVSLAESAAVSNSMFRDDDSPERIQIQKLAFEVSNRIEHATPITMTDLVTLILLCANGRALTEAEILAHGREILTMITAAQLPTAGRLRLELGDDFGTAMQGLTRTRLLEFHDGGSRPVYRIAAGKQLAAAYYRNTIVHYFLNPAIAELSVAMAMALEKPTPKILWDHAMEIRDLLKFEFFFKPKPTFKLEISDYLSARYPRWQMALQVPHERSQLLAGAAPLFGHGILRSFVEAFSVLSRVLLNAPADADMSSKALETQCLLQGKQMLWQRQITSDAALSKPLFANSIRLAQHRKLLQKPVDIADRQQFEMQIRALREGLDVLQRAYDDFEVPSG